MSDGVPSQDICVVGCTARERRGVTRELEALSIDTVSRDSSENTLIPGVRLANMHRIKGLEFRIVFLVGIRKGVMPLELATSNTDDPVEKRARDLNERALLQGARAVHGLSSNYTMSTITCRAL